MNRRGRQPALWCHSLVYAIKCMLCLMIKNWTPIKFSKKHAFRLPRIFSKNFDQIIVHFIPFCKGELFKTSVNSERKTD